MRSRAEDRAGWVVVVVVVVVVRRSVKEWAWRKGTFGGSGRTKWSDRRAETVAGRKGTCRGESCDGDLGGEVEMLW